MSEVAEVKNAIGWRDWVAALRSDKYQQGKGYLCSEKGYCCWGVACDLVDPTKWNGPKDFSSGPLWYGDDPLQTGFPPNSVIKALGVEKLNVVDYTVLNDKKGVTFSQIADAIEKEMTADGSY